MIKDKVAWKAKQLSLTPLSPSTHAREGGSESATTRTRQLTNQPSNQPNKRTKEKKKPRSHSCCFEQAHTTAHEGEKTTHSTQTDTQTQTHRKKISRHIGDKGQPCLSVQWGHWLRERERERKRARKRVDQSTKPSPPPPKRITEDGVSRLSQRRQMQQPKPLPQRSRRVRVTLRQSQARCRVHGLQHRGPHAWLLRQELWTKCRCHCSWGTAQLCQPWHPHCHRECQVLVPELGMASSRALPMLHHARHQPATWAPRVCCALARGRPPAHLSCRCCRSQQGHGACVA